MPNTLAHVGIQGVFSRAIWRDADLKWICVGSIIPDFPWIMQRMLPALFPGIGLYDLRLYSIIQASLGFCLLLSFALALLVRRSGRIFSILALGAIVHLLLDATQIKWANGVHLLAPFDWRMTQFGWFWPESLPTYALTGFGLIYFLVNWKRGVVTPVGLASPAMGRWLAAAVVLCLYFGAPITLLDAPERRDNHFVRTLREVSQRPGRLIELDRARYEVADGSCLRGFSGEVFSTDLDDMTRSETVSVKGLFLSPTHIHVSEYHVHSRYFRDYASYTGLVLVFLLFLHTTIGTVIAKTKLWRKETDRLRSAKDSHD